MGSKYSSGINRFRRAIREASVTGAMPKYINVNPDNIQDLNKVYEYIDRYYEYPSEDYLSKTGLDMNSLSNGWTYRRKMVPNDKDSGSHWEGEYEFTKTLRLTTPNGGLSMVTMNMPAGTSRSARVGLQKHAIYQLLSLDRNFDTTQFIRREHRGKKRIYD